MKAINWQGNTMVKKFALLLITCSLWSFPLICPADTMDGANKMDEYHYPASDNAQSQVSQSTHDDQDSSTNTVIQDDDAASDIDTDNLTNTNEDTN